jgi:hypothetical protein
MKVNQGFHYKNTFYFYYYCKSFIGKCPVLGGKAEKPSVGVIK